MSLWHSRSVSVLSAFCLQVPTVSSFNALCKMSCCTGLQFFLGKVHDFWQSGQSQLFGILVIFKQDEWNSETGHDWLLQDTTDNASELLWQKHIPLGSTGFMFISLFSECTISQEFQVVYNTSKKWVSLGSTLFQFSLLGYTLSTTSTTWLLLRRQTTKSS